MNKDVFQFDAASHRYRLNGVLIPGISFVLEQTGFVDKTWFKPEHAERGHAVHAACLYLIEGKLDWATVHESIRPRIEGFKVFMEKYRPYVLMAEKPLYSGVHGFAGTPDLVFEPYGQGGGVWVLDIKSGRSGLAAKLQTAAQAILAAEALGPHVPIHARYALELPAAGGFKLIQHTDRGDRDMFLNGLAMVKRRINEGEIAL